MTPRPFRQLVIALPLALLLHAAAALILVWGPPASGAQGSGLGGIEVSLGPSGGSPGEAAELEPEPPKLPEPEPAVARPRPKPEAPVRVPLEVPEAPQVTGEPALVVETPGLEPAPPVVLGDLGPSGLDHGPDAGSADDARGGGVPGASADYVSYVLAWLQKHKQYPLAARRRRQEGTALIYFEMDREGHVLQARLERSSGHHRLDDEALALLARADPLPVPPDDIEGERIKLLVPVEFLLR